MNLGQPISAGNTADIYLYDNKVYKLYKAYMPDFVAEYEAGKQRLACDSGLPVPKVLEITKIDGRNALVMEYVPGRSLGSLILKDMENIESYVKTSVEIQRSIHAVKCDSMEPMRVKLERQLRAAASLDDNYKNALLEKLSQATYESMLCHGDFHVMNLIQAENDVKVIDWVDASSGDIRADVYRTYLLYSQSSAQLADMYLRLYCEASGLTKEDIFIWAPIIAGARLSEHMPDEVINTLLEIVYKYCLL